MSCTLSIIGKNLDVQTFIAKSKLRPHHVFLKGEPIFKTKIKSKLRAYSGISIVTSKADFDNLKIQIKDTISFLQRNKEKLKCISTTKEIQYATLNFGVDSTIHKNMFSQSEVFPNKLLRIAGELGLDLEISLYLKSAK